MTAIISSRYLSQTRLQRVPLYEEIINVIKPDVEPKIPRRAANDHYRSHFNIFSPSAERLKEMENCY